jgi:hypothetical protein
MLIERAPWMTWLFVRTYPLASTTTPDPFPLARPLAPVTTMWTTAEPTFS